jgi:hypothetical protein
MSWTPIPNYEGFYKINREGEIKSMDRIIVDKHGRKQPVKGRIKKQFVNAAGYSIVSLSKGRINTTCLLHRLLALTFIPNPEDKPEVDHINRDKTNNSIDNLRWATRSENKVNRNTDGFPVGTSGQRYIVITKEGNFQVRIPGSRINNIRGFCLGTFDTLKEAKSQRDACLTGDTFMT